MAIGQIYHNVWLPGSNSFQSTGDINIYNDFISQYDTSRNIVITSLSVQAPPGSQIVLNNLKTMMIGRTGVLSLDNVEIRQARFVRPPIYVTDESSTIKNLRDGMIELWSLQNNEFQELSNAANNLSKVTGNTANSNVLKYRDNYNKFCDKCLEYIEAFNIAVAIYNQGRYSVYKLKEENGEKVYDDLKNVVVDFVYTVENS